MKGFYFSLFTSRKKWKLSIFHSFFSRKESEILCGIQSHLYLCSQLYFQTLPKAQRTRGLSSYHKFKHKSWSNFIFRISTKHQLQNLNQTSASRLNLKFKILAKPSLRTSTNNKIDNLNQRSAAKSGWQKLRGSTGGTRRKVWTRTKILSPNIRYFVAN